MFDLSKLKNNYSKLYHEILNGLGMTNAKPFQTKGIEEAFRISIQRESTDGMFATDETWLCSFMYSDDMIYNFDHVQSLIQSTIAADVKNLFAVFCGELTTDAEEELYDSLAKENIQVVVLTEILVDILFVDFCKKSLSTLKPQHIPFSFAHIRNKVTEMVKDVPWRKYYQTTSVQPARILPLHGGDSTLSEADLTRAMEDGSFLLLGEPGAGKTTSFMAMAEMLSKSGARTPIFIPLGQYQGNFMDLFCTRFSSGPEAISKELAIQLLTSGALVLLLDGINEVQDKDLQFHLVNELNQLTNPQEQTSRTRWIVSGRVHDYQQTRLNLKHLDSHRWEMQPLTADLIFRFLADALGEDTGKIVFENLDQSVRDISGNPLILNMVLSLYQEKGFVPTNRGAIYHQFVALKLEWGKERTVEITRLKQFFDLFPEKQNNEDFQDIVFNALTTLSIHMISTFINWSDAQRFVAQQLNCPDQRRAASFLLEDLIMRNILKKDDYQKISFFHHTFKEYFQARNLIECSLETLIPDNGVPASKRESIIFLSGIHPKPEQLVQRALSINLMLAYQMFQNLSPHEHYDLYKKLAKKIWSNVLRKGGISGSNRRFAILFQKLANATQIKVKDLASEIDSHLDQTQKSQNLISFYRQLGDTGEVQRILNQVMEGEIIPDNFMSDAGWTAYGSGDYEKAIEFYTNFLQKNADNDAVYNNRALAYKMNNQKEQALQDYQQSIEIKPKASSHNNLADLLHSMDRKEEAFKHIDLALELDSTFASAHSSKANWLESEKPEIALYHREMAVKYAPHDDRLRIYYRKLAELQESLGQHGNAIQTLRKMINLDPTSSTVISWKKRIAKLRQKLDAEERKQSARERLLEKGDLPIPTLAYEWMKAAGLEVNNYDSRWMIGEGAEGLPEILPVVLLLEPELKGTTLIEAMNVIPREAKKAKEMIVLTAAEMISIEARHQLSALQENRTVALVTALEVRDALLQGDRECYQLICNIIKRAESKGDPFYYKGFVQEQTEFFGREKEFYELTELIGRGQQVGLFGIHKIGKTSLLEQLRRKLHMKCPEISVIQIEMNTSMKNASDLYFKILEELKKYDISPDTQISSEAFRQKLITFHREKQQKRKNHRVLLMLDEYAYLIPNRQGKKGLSGFLEVLGLFKSMNQEGWFTLLPCGRTDALNTRASFNDDENPLIDMLHSHFLSPLSQEENDTLMQTLGLKVGLTFTKEALDLIYEETGGHPSFSRVLGSFIHKKGHGEVTPHRVNEAVGQLLKDRNQIAIFLAIYEDRMDSDEQDIVQQITQNGPQPKKKLFPEDAEIKHRRQIRDAIANLINTHVLMEQNDGRIAHRFGLFRRVIETMNEDLGL
ncbi:ATPase domain protein, prokaryote domain protein [Candidatus Magnetomorum sp. HK-1]|nr:ATPase domain protein, prokaryote domain protein [Candidatus Magnetomorum sp. HK-1]